MKAPRRRSLGMLLLAAAVAAPAWAEAQCLAGATPRPLHAAPAGFSVWPRHGRAPLEVKIEWAGMPVPSPVSFEIEVESVPTSSAARYVHVFAERGTYRVAGRVTDREGRVVSASDLVYVESSGLFDAEVGERWVEFKNAVTRGKVEEAIGCVTSSTRHLARTALAPGQSLAVTVPLHMNALTFAGRSGPVDVQYRTDVVNGRTLTLTISPDLDGIWRINARGWAPQEPRRRASPRRTPASAD